MGLNRVVRKFEVLFLRINSVIEIVLGIWFGSFILSFLVIFFHRKMIIRKFQDTKIYNLNRNVGSLDFFWSIADSDFKKLNNLSLQAAVALDKKRALSHAWLLSPLCLLSFVGFILVCAFVIGSHFVGKSRKEQLVFESELVTSKDLSAITLKKLFSELNQITW